MNRSLCGSLVLTAVSSVLIRRMKMYFALVPLSCHKYWVVFFLKSDEKVQMNNIWNTFCGREIADFFLDLHWLLWHVWERERQREGEND